MPNHLTNSLYKTLLEYWLLLTSIFYVLCYRLQNTISREKNPSVFHNVHHVYIVDRVRKNIYSLKKKHDLCAVNVSDISESRRYYSSTFRAVDVHSEQKVPSPVSGIICRYISAGRLNCNIWFSPPPRPTVILLACDASIMQTGFGNTGLICVQKRAFGAHKRILQRVNSHNVFSVRLVYIGDCIGL